MKIYLIPVRVFQLFEPVFGTLLTEPYRISARFGQKGSKMTVFWLWRGPLSEISGPHTSALNWPPTRFEVMKKGHFWQIFLKIGPMAMSIWIGTPRTLDRDLLDHLAGGLRPKSPWFGGQEAWVWGMLSAKNELSKLRLAKLAYPRCSCYSGGAIDPSGSLQLTSRQSMPTETPMSGISIRLRLLHPKVFRYCGSDAEKGILVLPNRRTGRWWGVYNPRPRPRVGFKRSTKGFEIGFTAKVKPYGLNIVTLAAPLLGWSMQKSLIFVVIDVFTPKPARLGWGFKAEATRNQWTNWLGP